VDVDAQADIVGKIIAGVVGIFIDHDVVVVPEPIVGIVVVVRCELEVDAADAEPLAAAAAKPPDVLRANAEGEASMFPGMVQMIVLVAAAGVVSHPNIILVDMRGLGMAGLIVKSAPLILLWRRSRAAVDRPTITVRRCFSTCGRPAITVRRRRSSDRSAVTVRRRSSNCGWPTITSGWRCSNRSRATRGNISVANALVAATLLRLGWLRLVAATLLRLGRLRLLTALLFLFTTFLVALSESCDRERQCSYE
jgi:hypothetical protein